MTLWILSPSLRGRGLKFAREYGIEQYKKGRPLYEGVDWNKITKKMEQKLISRPLYEGVDWNLRIFWVLRQGERSRPLYEGVDWNFNRKSNALRPWVALFTRAWIEINYFLHLHNIGQSRPLYEGVDWNYFCKWQWFVYVLSPSLRGRGLKLRHIRNWW